MKRRLILASSSPRRREILEKMGLEFKIIPSDYEEFLDSSEFSYKKIETLAYKKAKVVADDLQEPALIIGADTVVVLNEEILGKPKDEIDAMEMLKQLSGKKHFVVTSICVIDSKTFENKTFSTTSYVEFNTLTDRLIEDYVETYKPMDKAGSYGIQELPDGFVSNIEGSFENIIGLCPLAVERVLNEFDINLPFKI